MKCLRTLAALSMFAALLCCTEKESPAAARLVATVTNKTDQDFTDVGLNGNGYPGSIGILVAHGNTTMSYYANQIDAEFEVAWHSVSGTHVVKAFRPDYFTVSHKRELVVEIASGEKVSVYTRPLPGQANQTSP